MAPVIMFHSVIDNPEPVNLVTPPSITWISNIKTPMPIHIATGLDEFFIMPAKVGESGHWQ
jgi:hypothetical protein